MKRTHRAFFADSSLHRSKSKTLPFLLGGIIILAVFFVCSILAQRFISKKIHNSPSITMLKDKWKEYDYQAVYDTSGTLLIKQPYNNTILTYRGYAAFYLAVSETISSQAQEYIDEAVRALCLATINAKSKTLPQIYYMLGKTYFWKNKIFAYHYYADLAVKYLMLAKQNGFKADDISEYLGLSYVQLGLAMESIAAFSEALLVRESDTLLLNIAEQYSIAGQQTAAKQYLFQIIKHNEDDSLVTKSRFLLGKILIEEKDFDGAQKEFQAILGKNENSADAHYGLGLVYEGRGDLAKARAEWRKTLRIQINHADAISKIQYYR